MMNQFDPARINQLISYRRTIKPGQFSDKEISREIIEQLLQNANWAPTHGYTEPWRFVVFSGEGKMNFARYHAELYKKETPEEKFRQGTYDKHLDRAAQTSHIIAVVMKRGDNPKIPEIEEIVATGCAIQNIWLSASAYGIGCYLSTGGMTYHPEMARWLGFSEDDKVLGFFYLGYPDVEWPRGRRVSGAADKVRWEDHSK